MEKILLVDDERDILEFVSYNLSKEGFQVITCGDYPFRYRKGKIRSMID